MAMGVTKGLPVLHDSGISELYGCGLADMKRTVQCSAVLCCAVLRPRVLG